jgi:hypothetical protein
LDEFYISPREDLWPGDIFVDLPSIYLRAPPVTYLRRLTGRGGRPIADLYVLGDGDAQLQQGQPPFNPNDDEAAVQMQLASALLLTQGCEIDNSPGACVQLALIRPLRAVSEENKESIREGRNSRYMYLPPNDDPLMEEGYVDFSRISSVRQEALEIGRRILSGAPELVQALHILLLRYFARWDLSEDIVQRLIAEREAKEQAETGG